MLARRFLYVMAGLVVLALAGAFAYRLYAPQLIRAAMVPSARFVEQPRMPVNAWNSRDMWHARPDIAGNPALYLPPGFEAGLRGNAVTFFIHPTSYLDRTAWNASLTDATANNRAQLFLRGQASAFLTGQREAQLALDAAYVDVLAAWDAFIAAVPAGRPIIVAGHSQGSLHLTRLLRERIAGRAIARRIVAAYVVGWPVSLDTDIAALGLPGCTAADQPGCIISWQSFAEPADPAVVSDTFDASTGFDGRVRRGTKMLCINPLTGTPDTAAPATANLGALVPSADLSAAVLEPGTIPARCDGGRGFLLIGAPPTGFGTYVLPGNNYHVFDYTLFWASVRADAARRLAAFER